MGSRKKKLVLVFDENARKEFLSGFHKRKQERKKKAQQKLENDLKEAKKLIKAKARETYQKYLNPYKPISNEYSSYEDQYELPHHSVKVQELLDEDIVNENNWIGPNRGLHIEEKLVSSKVNAEDGVDDETDGIPLTSVREIKKLVNKQSRNIMQCNKAFKKKNRLERLKSKKKAARKKRNLEKEKKKLKGRKRK